VKIEQSLAALEQALIDEHRKPKRGKDDRAPRSREGAQRLTNKARTAYHTINGTPQAILRITSYGRNREHVTEHALYIFRRAGELENELGERITDPGHVRDVINEWSTDFEVSGEDQQLKYKIAFKIKLGQNVAALKDEVREFMQANYPDLAVRLDRGRSKNTKNTLYATVRCREPDGHLPNKKAMGDQVAERFPKSKTEITTVKPKELRESLNMILSTPEGTDPEVLRVVAREFARETFGEDHRYVMALHTNTAHPHVHLCVKLRNEQGIKLDPKKAQLQRWRLRYAALAREHGIEMEASYRSERGIGMKAQKSPLVQARRRLRPKLVVHIETAPGDDHRTLNTLIRGVFRRQHPELTVQIDQGQYKSNQNQLTVSLRTQEANGVLPDEKMIQSLFRERLPGLPVRVKTVNPKEQLQGNEKAEIMVDRLLRQEVKRELQGQGESARNLQPWKVAMVKKNLKEKAEFEAAAKILRNLAHGHSDDPNKQKEYIALAVISEKHARTLPEPKTRMEKIVETVRTKNRGQERDSGPELER